MRESILGGGVVTHEGVEEGKGGRVPVIEGSQPSRVRTRREEAVVEAAEPAEGGERGEFN